MPHRTSPTLLLLVTAILVSTGASALRAETTERIETPPADTATTKNEAATDPPPAPNKYQNDGYWLTWPKMTGDWGGARTELSKHGIDFDLRLTQYYQGVASGGVNTNFAYGGTMDYRINIDAEKLANLKGLSFNMHARSRFGRDINSDAGAFALQNMGMLMPAQGGYHDTDITGLTASYTFPIFGGKRLGNILVGKFDVIDLVTSLFPNVAYGQEGFMNVNAQVSALPWFGAVQGLSLYGGWAVTIHPKYQTAESGFLLTGTHNVATEWGSLSDSFEDGVWMAAFHRFFWELDGKMGYFMVFAGASTKKQASNDSNDFVFIPGQGIKNTDKKRPWDVAFYLYQEIWRSKDNSKRKANFMIGGTVGPDNPQFSNWNIFANVEMFGPFASRPNDRTGISGWYNNLSGNFKELTSKAGIELQDMWGVEAYYNIEVTPWLHLSPNLQILQNQNAGDDPAVIVGFRSVIEF